MGGSWGLIWIVWASSAIVWFLAVELTAIAEHRMDRTLSARIRALLGVSPPRRRRRVASAIFASVLVTGIAVFIVHILHH